MYGKMQESGIIEVTSSISISAIWGRHLVVLISHIPDPQLLSNHHGGVAASAGLQVLFSLLGGFIHDWRPQIAEGCYILVYCFGRRYSISYYDLTKYIINRFFLLTNINTAKKKKNKPQDPI